jgi:hypothetical protein
MAGASRVLFITRCFLPKPVGPAPSSSDFAKTSADIAKRRHSDVRMAELRPNDDLVASHAVDDVHLVAKKPNAASFAVPPKVFDIFAVRRRGREHVERHYAKPMVIDTFLNRLDALTASR